MKYDSNQLAQEIAALTQNKEVAFQQFHKICGAIEVLEVMQKQVLETEKEEQAKLADEESAELEPVPEHSEAA